MGPSSNSLGYMRPRTEHVENHDGDPDRDRRVGDVESPEMITAPVDVDKIDDRTGDDAVDEVAGRAADDEREAEPRNQLMVREIRRVHPDADERRRGDDGDQHRLERKLRAVEDAECR